MNRASLSSKAKRSSTICRASASSTPAMPSIPSANDSFAARLRSPVAVRSPVYSALSFIERVAGEMPASMVELSSRSGWT